MKKNIFVTTYTSCIDYDLWSENQCFNTLKEAVKCAENYINDINNEEHFDENGKMVSPFPSIDNITAETEETFSYNIAEKEFESTNSYLVKVEKLEIDI